MTEDSDRAMRPKDVGKAVGFRRGPEQGYICERHGPYRGKPFSITAGRSWLSPRCPACEREERERERQQQATESARIPGPRERRAILAGIPERFRQATFDGYTASGMAQEAARKAAEVFSERFAVRRQDGGSMMFIGRPGTGKTHLACATLMAVVSDDRWTGRYTDAWSLMSEVKATWRRTSPESEEEVIQRYVRPDLLVLDEVGVQYGSDTERAILHRVLDLRYQAMRPTIVVGNVKLEGMKDYLGERAVSRLMEGGKVIPFEWEDHRQKK